MSNKTYSEILHGDDAVRVLLRLSDHNSAAREYGSITVLEAARMLAQILEQQAPRVTLPDDPPDGYVRCRAAVATDEQGNACVYGFDFTDHEGDPDVGDWQDVTRESVYSRRNHSGVVLDSFVTFDAPKPQPPAEVVGTVEVGDE